MKIEDLPEIKHLNQQLKGFKVIMKVNKALRFFGLGSKKIAEMDQKLETISKELQDHQITISKFNIHFSKDGWIAHDSMNLEIMKKAIQAFERGEKEDSQKILLNYYSAEELEGRIFMLKHVEEIRVRHKFIEFALKDYKEERYYSVIPLLLMIIDGAVNDAVGKGFHTETDQLDVWGAITTVDGGITTIKDIFRKGRQKTRTDNIELPYRNGILHGLDLGYDNLIVAAKCWCFLFVVKDWIHSKKTEQKRIEKFEEETRVPSFKEITKGLLKNEETKKELEKWKPRIISTEYLKSINTQKQANPEQPEFKVLSFMALWEKSNFGKMAELYPSRYSTKSKRPGELRAQLGSIEVEKYSISKINDDAPAITEVTVSTKTKFQTDEEFKFRLIYEDSDGGALPSSMKGGVWTIISIE